MTTAWAFGAAGFVTSVSSLHNGTTLDSHTYLRDAVGNITQETLTGSSNSTSTFGYDDLYRLTSATVAGTGYSWSYDPVGNRVSQSVGGVNTSYTVDAADHLLTVNGAAVVSDANGNVLQDDLGGAYTWDVRGRLIGLTKSGNAYAFQYGSDGLRLTKTVNGALTTYLLDGGQVVTDTINGTANQTLYGPGTDHALARNGEFFLPNSLGSTSLLTDNSGNPGQSYQYRPFGELLGNATDSNPFQYTGRENDGDGLLYYRARYYNPAWGRFVSADPAGAGINPYVYAGNNPVGFGGPSGRERSRFSQFLYDLGVAFGEYGGLTPSPHDVRMVGDEANSLTEDLDLADLDDDPFGSNILVRDPLPPAAPATEPAAAAPPEGGYTLTADQGLLEHLGDNTFFHYTDDAGLQGILQNQLIRANARGNVYVTQLMLDPVEAFNRLFIGNPLYAGRARNVVAIQIEGVPFNVDPSTGQLIHVGSIRFGTHPVIYAGPNPF